MKNKDELQTEIVIVELKRWYRLLFALTLWHPSGLALRLQNNNLVTSSEALSWEGWGRVRVKVWECTRSKGRRRVAAEVLVAGGDRDSGEDEGESADGSRTLLLFSICVCARVRVP